jgi:hypothetical protein
MRLLGIWCVLAAAGLLAGCGGGKANTDAQSTATAAAATPTPTASAPAALTSAADLQACVQLENTVRAVSLVVGHTSEEITKAQHPKELAQKIATAQHSLIDSARVVEIVRVTPALADSRHQFAQALRQFAADFARAKRTTATGDMQKATEQLTDENALRKIQTSAKKIDELCGA